MEVYRPVIGGRPASSAYAMPCGTSRVLSTTPATTSLASHSRRYDEGLSPRASLNIGTYISPAVQVNECRVCLPSAPASSPPMGEQDRLSPGRCRHHAHVDHVEPQAADPLDQPGQGTPVRQFGPQRGRAGTYGDLAILELRT